VLEWRTILVNPNNTIRYKYKVQTVLESPKTTVNHEVIKKILYKLLENKRHGRGREMAQTPVQGLLFSQEPCGKGPQQES
jgi:hypothetical protein